MKSNPAYKGKWHAPQIDNPNYKEGGEAAISGGLKVQKMVLDLLYKVADVPFLGKHKSKVLDLLEKAEKQPNLTIGVFFSIIVVIFTVFLKLIFGGKQQQPNTCCLCRQKLLEAKKVMARHQVQTQSSHREEKKEQNEDAAAPRRRARREN
ncbi:hypothetical protein HAX54_027068 [Datura stramonium]|uniref:Uncharacterized protein n=1 Tax=Datura stramonium TaxID=4076 RepID=A0ABS8S8F7_DATST|nr:hypothetical protein [Datura stramonium]